MKIRLPIHRSRLAAIIFALFPSMTAYAAEGKNTPLVVTGVLTVVIVAIVFFALLLPEQEHRALGEAVGRLRKRFVQGRDDRVPVLDDDFDGIKELDNKTPPWFTTLFVVTIVFAIVYLIDYHVLKTSKLSEGEYQEEITAADLHRRIILATEGQIDETQLTALTDGEAIKRGEENFRKYCVSCHGDKGQGLVGPNLTDDYWIHGGTVRNVYATVKMGVPAKGMISWQLVFTPKQMQEIASFVLSLRGTNPPGAKKPEGTLMAEPAPAAAATETGKPAL